MSWRSSLSMKPSLFWSIMLKASLNSWIWDWSNIANTLEVARWGRFLVFFPLALLLDMLAVDGSPSPVTHIFIKIFSYGSKLTQECVSLLLNVAMRLTCLVITWCLSGLIIIIWSMTLFLRQDVLFRGCDRVYKITQLLLFQASENLWTQMRECSVVGLWFSITGFMFWNKATCVESKIYW